MRVKMKINNLEQLKSLVEKINVQLKDVNENLEELKKFELDIELQK